MIIGLDTETQDGYAILITKPWSFCEPASFDDCVDFLASDKESACWNADYDCQAILKWLPVPVRDRLALLGEVTFRTYHIKYIPHKFMRIWECEYYQAEPKLLVTVYDLRQFYACSLAVAAVKLGVKRKGDIPKSWYKQMLKKLKDPKTRQRVLDYALRDAQIVQQIINKTAESFALAGLKFERPFSNASFAERYFRKKFKYRRKFEVEKMARAAYHGGRIECLQAGYFPVAYHYDIHSAYPSIIANLVKPDGEWIYERKPGDIRSDAVYAFVDCSINIPKSERVGPIPIRRRSGVIFYPVGRFRKTVTLGEFRYLQERGWINRIFSSWVHIWPKWVRPFSEIADIYRKRKEDKRVDYAFKIVMNSVYGKLAQVIEQRVRTNIVDSRSEIFDDRVWKKYEKWKDHTSFVYASEITAQIRLKLLRDIPPESVICYSTDGVFTTCEIPLPTGNGLGEWSTVETVRDLIVVGSGVYTYSEMTPGDLPLIVKGEGPESMIVKFRGFSPAFDLKAMLERAGRRHSIGIVVTRNTSLKLAAKGGKHRKKMNVLEETRRYLNVNFDNKRNWEALWTARELTKRRYQSKPWIYYGVIKLKR